MKACLTATVHGHRWAPAYVASAAIIAATLLAGCGGKTDAARLDQAKALLAKNDLQAAAIELKTFLSDRPDTASARTLLGEALYRQGDFRGAVVELQRALTLNGSEAEILPLLALSMVASGESKKLIVEYASREIAEKLPHAQFRAALATAFGSQGQQERAEATARESLALDPSNSLATSVLARLMAQRGDATGGVALLRALTEKGHGKREAWSTLGQLLWSTSADKEQALAAVDKSLALDPSYVPAHAVKLNIYLSLRDFTGYRAAFTVMRKAAPNHIETRFHEAQLAFVDNDLKLARDLTAKLLAAVPESPAVLELSGAVLYQQNALGTAESQLAKALQYNPAAASTRQLLARVHLKQGMPDHALRVLQPLLAVGAKPTAITLAMAAESHLMIGAPAKAEAFFRRAAEAEPANAKLKTSIALMRVAQGDLSTGINLLTALSATDEGTRADLAMANIHIQRKEYAAALSAVAQLERKAPKDPTADFLRGQIQLLQNDNGAARKSFTTALGKSPGHVQAAMQLVQVELRTGNVDAARALLKEQIKTSPTTSSAYTMLAEIGRQTGAPEREVFGLLSDAVNTKPQDPFARVALIDHLLRQRMFKQAVDAGQSAVAAIPDHPTMHDALGRAQLLAGDTLQAVQSFNKMAALDPASPQPYMRISEAYIVGNDIENAIRSIKRAIEIKPNFTEAHRRLAQLSVSSRRTADALAAARDLQKAAPKSADGYLLEGDVLRSQKRWDESAAAFNKALKLRNTGDVALRVHQVQQLAGNGELAAKFASEWLQRNPKDVSFLYYLAYDAMLHKRNAVAESHFRSILNLRSGDTAALNNLAWVLLLQGKSGALEFAQLANKLKPNDGPIMDTLANIHANAKNFDEASKWQKQAVSRMPNNTVARLSLAKFLLAANRKDEAIAELQSLAKLGAKAPNHAEINSLLKTL